MKLVHKSGSLRCNQIDPDPDSYWGCTFSLYKNSLMTLITNVKREAILPSTEDMEEPFTTGHRNCREKHFYHLDGIDHKTPELVFRNLSNPLSLSRGQELRIWYGQDWKNCSENGNNGTICVDVFALYI